MASLHLILGCPEVRQFDEDPFNLNTLIHSTENCQELWQKKLTEEVFVLKHSLACRVFEMQETFLIRCGAFSDGMGKGATAAPKRVLSQ